MEGYSSSGLFEKKIKRGRGGGGGREGRRCNCWCWEGQLRIYNANASTWGSWDWYCFESRGVPGADDGGVVDGEVADDANKLRFCCCNIAMIPHNCAWSSWDNWLGFNPKQSFVDNSAGDNDAYEALGDGCSSSQSISVSNCFNCLFLPFGEVDN